MSDPKIEIANKQVEKCLRGLPQYAGMQFMVELDSVSKGNPHSLEIEHLTSVGRGVIELKINGNPGPGYRCVYTTKIPGKIVILHAFKKTKNGPDVHNCNVAKQRLKSL